MANDLTRKLGHLPHNFFTLFYQKIPNFIFYVSPRLYVYQLEKQSNDGE